MEFFPKLPLDKAVLVQLKTEKLELVRMIYIIFVLIQFDTSLQSHHNMYKYHRTSGAISSARVLLVRPGTFSDLRGLVVSRTTASVDQYKTPRKLRTRELLEWIGERVLMEDT